MGDRVARRVRELETISPGERRRRRFDNPDTWSFNDTAASPPATWNLLITVSKFIHNAFSGYVELHEKLRARTPPKAGRLRLATWNVSNLPTTREWGGNVTEESMKLKLDNMAAVIKLSKSDIVVMQEIKVNYRMWTDANGWTSPHPLVSELRRRLSEEDLEADWQDETSGPSRYDGSTAAQGKAEAYAIFWKRARVKKELGEDVKAITFVYDERGRDYRGRDYSTSFLEDTKWAEYDGTRHDVIFADEDGNEGSARRPAYFYLKGGKGAIVIATLHNASESARSIRMRQLEHVDWLLPGQRVDKTKVLFALMGDFNQKLEDGASTKNYLRKFWAGCDKVGLRRCSSDNLKTSVKKGTHYDDIFVTGDFDGPAACFPTYEDLESWGGWEQFLPAEYNDWAKFKSRILSDHLLVYADVWPLMPLHDASKEGNIGFVQQWLDRGADVNQADEEGRTPLFVACREGHVDAARLLLDKGADVDRAMENGQTPLYIACQNGHVDAARLLLDKGADVNRARENGATPLYIACQEGHVAVARLLLDNGADVDRATEDGATPLFIACQEGHVAVARLLLDNGADVDRATEDGATPLHMARSQGHAAVVALLEEHRN